MSTVSVADVKARLNKTVSADDAEIQTMIDAAEACYTRLIGPVGGTITETFTNPGPVIVLRSANVTGLTAASYDTGDTLTVTDLNVGSSGIVRWNYGTVGAYLPGPTVSLTYTVAALPADHYEIIVADVAGYFETTQRGGGSLRPSFPGEGEYEAAYASTPAVLFPRIEALARSMPTVA